MAADTSTGRRPGVYFDDGAEEQLVHEYTDADYELDDIFHSLGLGRLETGDGRTVIVLEQDEVRRLKVLADAESFDHPEDFILMCLDIHRFALTLAPGAHRFHEQLPDC